MNTNTTPYNGASPFKVVLPYILFSAVYIYASDYVVRAIAGDVDMLSRLQTVKGIGFIVTTAIMLYLLTRNNISTVSVYYKALISQRIQTETEINKYEDKYWKLFNSSPVPMWIFDRQTLRFLLVNEAACSKYGYTLEEFGQMTLENVRPEEDIPLLRLAIESNEAQQRMLLPSLFRHKKKNGAIIYVKVECSQIIFEDRAATLVLATDMSAELEMTNELLEANQVLKSASEIAKLGYWSNDFKTGIITWSEELYRIFEAEKGSFELTLPNIASRYHKDFRGDFGEDWEQRFNAQGRLEAERMITTVTGKDKWIHERINMVRGENGIPVRLEGVAVDITSRKQAEQQIQETNDRFRMLAQTTLEAIMDWDIQTNNVFVGKGFQELFGYDPADANNINWVDRIYPEDKLRVVAAFRAALKKRDNEFFYSEFRFMKANGEITYVQHRGVFIRDSKGWATRAVGAIIDVTEARNKLDEIKRQNKILKEIAWIQSHIVRAPLANLMGMVQVLADNDYTDISQQEVIGAIASSAEKLDMVIREISHKTAEVEQRQDTPASHPQQQGGAQVLAN